MNSLWRAAVRAFTGVCLLSATLVSQLFAQSERIPEEVLAKRAQIIAVGKVLSTRAQWEENKSRIVTYVTVSVDQYLKGTAERTITIASPGGEVDGVGELYSHTVDFSNNEEVVVFAEKEKQGRYRVSGGQQGKLTVTRDKLSGKVLVGNTRTLDDFSARIRQIVNVNGN